MMVSGCCTKSYKTASYKQRNVSYASAEPAGSYSTEQVQTPTPTGRTEEGSRNMVVPLYQENLNVGKREVDSGTVKLRKVVKTETVNQPIELRHEELVIDRDNGTGKNGEQILAQPFQEQETVIRLKREEPVIEKQTAQAGEVVIQTRTAQEQRNVQAEVRREDIDIDRHGAKNVIISQNLHRSVRAEESSGAGETSSGQTSGTGAGVQADVITDPGQLSADVSTFSGKQVRFAQCKVDRVIGERLIVLKANNGQKIYVVSNETNANCKQGDMVTITGTVDANASEAGLSGEASQELSNRPFYIKAQSVQISNQ